MEVFIYMSAAVTLGVCAIILVSGELSFISGISKSGRYILAFFLSFGVLGFSVKTIAIGLLHQNTVMNATVDASKSFNTYLPGEGGKVKGLTYAPRGPEWKRLPTLSFDLTPEKIELGKRLFFDKRLSATGEISCASCHDIPNGGDDARTVSVGVNGLKGGRNAPTVINAVYMRKLFWDGRAKSLAEQVGGPLTNPVEMAMSSMEDVAKIISNDPKYRHQFQQIYNQPASGETITDAIAAFEKTLISNDSPYDRFVSGEHDALNEDQIQGMVLFNKIGCRKCHMDPTFTVAGIKNKSPFMPFPVFKDSPFIKKHSLYEDRGKGQNGAWRVPSLRNVEFTAPYFHNGAVTDLEEAVKVMATAQLGFKITDQPQNNIFISYQKGGPVVEIRNRSLTSQQVKQLVAFLKALSGKPLTITDPWQKK